MDEATVKHGSFSDWFRKKYRYSKPVLAIYILVFLSFPIAKGILRPWSFSLMPDSFLTLVLFSYPNFVEAIMGSCTLATILFVFREWFRERFRKNLMGDTFLYLTCIFLAAIFVITQEMKIHDLGGENIYDINDVYASCIGLIVILSLFLRYGVFVERKEFNFQ